MSWLSKLKAALKISDKALQIAAPIVTAKNAKAGDVLAKTDRVIQAVEKATDGKSN